MTLPSNTLSAAKSVAVPFRLSSCVIVPHRPFFRGRPGWVRSKAWIWLFSSTHNTIPFCGGFKYRPTTSVNFSMNLGSRDSLKVRLRCGLRLCNCQSRFTVLLLTPWALAMVRQLQCVIPLGLVKSTVNRPWQLHNLKPHLSRTFKLSRDPKFIEKLTDVVGLYLNPPQKGIVLCVDEKSQIQALDRTQPGLPLKKGRCGTMTHDYKRNGTATLFAALNVLDGKVIGECHGRHRHQEFLRFLRRLDWDFPGDQELHLVLDNYGTHKTPEVERWLKRHPRFVRHFIPTSSSWVNLVERWFGELTEKAVRRGAFFSVPD